MDRILLLFPQKSLTTSDTVDIYLWFSGTSMAFFKWISIVDDYNMHYGAAPAIMHMRKGAAPAVMHMRKGAAPAVYAHAQGAAPAVMHMHKG